MAKLTIEYSDDDRTDTATLKHVQLQSNKQVAVFLSEFAESLGFDVSLSFNADSKTDVGVSRK